MKNAKILFILSFLILFIIAGIFLTLSLLVIDYQKIYPRVFKNLTISHDFDKTEIGKFKITSLPSPFIYFESMKDPKNFEVTHLKINLSLRSVIKFDPEITSLEIDDLKIYLTQMPVGNDYEKLVKDYFYLENKVKIPITIKNLEFLSPNSQVLYNLKDLKFSGVESNNDEYALSARIFDLGNIEIVKNRDEDDKPQRHINLNNKDYKINITETFTDSKEVNHRGTLEITNLLNFISDFLPNTNILKDKVASHQPIILTFSMTHEDDNNKIEFNNINFTDAIFSGNGNAVIYLTDSKESTINLNFSNINLEALLKMVSEQPTINNIPNDAIDYRTKLFNLPLRISVKADEVILPNADHLKRASFLAHTQDHTMIIDELSAQIASGGNLNINGKVDGNKIRDVFSGKITIQHQDINRLLQIANINTIIKSVTSCSLAADFKITEIDSAINNLQFQTNEFKVTGNISNRFIGLIPRFSVNLDISAINLDQSEYPFITDILSYLNLLTQNMQDTNYFDKFIPIRTINYLGNLNLTFNNLTVDNTMFENVNLLLSIAPGKISVENLSLNKGSDYLTLKLNLDANNLKPNLDLNITSGIWHTDKLQFSNLLSLQNNLLNNFALNKVNINFSSQQFDIYQKNLLLRNNNFTLNNQNNIINIQNFYNELLGGTLTFNGNIDLEKNNAELDYALNSIDLTQLSQELPQDIIDTQGAASISGSLSTNGDTLESLLYNLYTKATLLAKGVKINNFSIDDLITKIAPSTDNSTLNNAVISSYEPNRFNNDLKSALLTGNTILKSLKSDIELKNGFLTLNNAILQTQNSIGDANGKMNIYDNFSLDIDTNFKFKAPENNRLRFYYRYDYPVSLPIKIGGTFFAPQKTPDISNINKYFESLSTN